MDTVPKRKSEWLKQVDLATEKLRSKPRFNLINADALLSHCVAVTNCHCIVIECFEVNSDAVRGSDFILTAIATADSTRIIKVDVPVLSQLCCKIASLWREIGIS